MLSLLPYYLGQGLRSLRRTRQAAQGIGHAHLAIRQPGLRFERHGQPRSGASHRDRNQRVLQVPKSPRVREPDIAGPEGLAQVKQDGHFP